jgi:hypothetical protein
MKRPDCYFTVTVCESWRLTACQKKRDLEARGMFGFHLYESCPDCSMEFHGWEFWGENGHKQGIASDRAQLCFWLRLQALKQWVMKDGRVMGYKFRRGGKQVWSR